MKGLLKICIVLSFLAGTCAYPASIVFEFSGRFGSCEADCASDPISSLTGAEYAGTLSIPLSAPDREPDSQNRPFSDEMLWSYYQFAVDEAFLTFETVGTLFDVFGGRPISAVVSVCDALDCFPKNNFSWFTYVGPEYSFTLNFGGIVDPALRSPKIPDVAGYAKFVGVSFDVYSNDIQYFITTNRISPLDSEMEIAISAVPLPSAGALLLSTTPFLWACLGRRARARASG